MNGPSQAECQARDVAVERVLLLIEARRPHDAVRVAYDALRASPHDATLTGLVGEAHLAAEDARGARQWAERSLGIDGTTAWVDDLLARAVLAGAGYPGEAIVAAKLALTDQPQRPDFLFTLVRACLDGRDRAGAVAAARALRHAAPTSELAPLADAMVELDRGHAYIYRQNTFLQLAVLAVVTQGTGLVLMGIWRFARAIWRAPYLRRADALLRDALQKAPASPSAHALTAYVLGRRFRFAQSVGHDVAAAALDTGIVEADALAASISRRTTAFTAVCTLAWFVAIAVADALVDADSAVAGIGAGSATVLVASIAAVERWQTRSLPPLLVRNVHRRWPQPIVAVGATTLLVSVGSTVSTGVPTPGFVLACLVAAPLVALAAGFVLVRFAAARRAA